MTAYYNENDPFAAAWLRELIKDGLIADGVVDERSITDVSPSDLDGFSQCHFFAGIGGWSYALRLAGWPDDKPVWTGSCPCQPFSQAGKQRGTSDKRHLWPEFHRLISECAPPIVFGEQVASRLGREWLAGIRADMETMGYGVGAADLCAPGVGAPHIRQRLYWVAHTERDPGNAWWFTNQSAESVGTEAAGSCAESGRRSVLGGVEYAACDGRVERWTKPSRRCAFSGCESSGVGKSHCAGRHAGQPTSSASRHGNSAVSASCAGGLGNTDNTRSQGRCFDAGEHADQRPPWASGVFIPCADRKARRVEPGIQPLAHGVPNRVGTLRGAGNAIVPQVAAAFIKACM